MSTYPTADEAMRTSDRAWDEVGHHGRVCASLTLHGQRDAAMESAQRYESAREWWQEASMQARELMRAARHDARERIDA